MGRFRAASPMCAGYSNGKNDHEVNVPTTRKQQLQQTTTPTNRIRITGRSHQNIIKAQEPMYFLMLSVVATYVLRSDAAVRVPHH